MEFARIKTLKEDYASHACERKDLLHRDATKDIAPSAQFYKRIFGWNIRKRGRGSTSFDDTVGEVSGTWVTGRPPAARPGLLFYVMVDSVARTLDVIVANGGECVQAIGGDAPKSLTGSGMLRET